MSGEFGSAAHAGVVISWISFPAHRLIFYWSKSAEVLKLCLFRLPVRITCCLSYQIEVPSPCSLLCGHVVRPLIIQLPTALLVAGGCPNNTYKDCWVIACPLETDSPPRQVYAGYNMNHTSLGRFLRAGPKFSTPCDYPWFYRRRK